jgi:hypothetical protein
MFRNRPNSGLDRFLMTTNGNLCYPFVALVKNGAGIAGKDSEWIWILARDCEPPYPPQTF